MHEKAGNEKLSQRKRFQLPYVCLSIRYDDRTPTSRIVQLLFDIFCTTGHGLRNFERLSQPEPDILSDNRSKFRT